jgi:hypothetical protein
MTRIIKALFLAWLGKKLLARGARHSAARRRNRHA